ncbi:MAG: lamin tail domain-containing protein [Candidatus Bipolaricaulia bacterium]
MRQVKRKVKVKTGVRVVGVLGLVLLIWFGISQPAFAPYHTAPQPQSPAPAQLVINEVLFLPESGEQLIEIANLGESEVDLSGWFLCNRPSYWGVPRGTTIGPGEFLVVHVGVRGENTETDLFAPGFARLNTTADEVALYSSSNFSSSSALVDFVQWGAARQRPTRLDVAISTGQWNSGEFVDVSDLEASQSIVYQGTGDGADAWTVGLATIGGPNEPTVEVDIRNFAFQPANIRVKVGTMVTWVQRDNVPHTVTSRTGLFDSGNLLLGQSFTFTFEKPGSYNYYCKIHPSMEGKVIVEEVP